MTAETRPPEESVSDQLLAVAKRLEEVADRLSRIAERLQGPGLPEGTDHP